MNGAANVAFGVRFYGKDEATVAHYERIFDETGVANALAPLIDSWMMEQLGAVVRESKGVTIGALTDLPKLEKLQQRMRHRSAPVVTEILQLWWSTALNSMHSGGDA